MEFMSVELYFICYKLNWSIFFRESAWVGREQADWSNSAIPPLNSSILWLMVIDLTAYTLFFSYQCYKIQPSDSCQVLKCCSVDHLSLHFSCLNIALLQSFGNVFLSFFNSWKMSKWHFFSQDQCVHGSAWSKYIDRAAFLSLLQVQSP